MQEVKQMLQPQFKMKDMGELQCCFGISIEQTRLTGLQQKQKQSILNCWIKNAKSR